MPFITRGAFDPIGDGRFRLIKGTSLVYRRGARVFEVPPGFVSDFATVPWFLGWLIHRNDHVRAFVLHDWLYAVGPVSRKESDDIMYEALIGLGCSNVEARASWIGVRLFGRRYWRKARKERLS